VKLLGVLLLSASALSDAQPNLPPIDEAGQQPDFFEFRERLVEAVGRRDAQYVRTIVDENIVASFGGDEGVEALVALWEVDSSDSRLWQVMESVLHLGGSFVTGEMFAAPYVYSTWPSSVDPFDYIAIIGAGVRVREGPSRLSPVIASLSHAVVAKFADAGSGDGWVAVHLADGRRGYVSSRYVRNPLDYRAVFQRKDGRWLLTAFVAGD
jgi:hypothetical protein